MGLSASQGKLLFMTARISNNEFEQQSIAYSKQRLANDASNINAEYEEALQKTQFRVLTGYNGTSGVYEDITYNLLTGYEGVACGKQYLIKDNKGKVLVSPEIAAAFELTNGDYNKFLAKLGYTQANIDITDAQASTQAIHDAWDRYFVSIGQRIDKVGEHKDNILSFSYDAVLKTPTYNSATATSQSNGKSYVLSKDDEGYYINRYEIKARTQNGSDDYEFYYTTHDGDEYAVQGFSYNPQDKTYTYKDTTANAFYAFPITNDEVDLSTTPKAMLEYGDFNVYTFKTSAGNYEYYNVTESSTPLVFEGATAAQRELYDYANAITEAYYNKANPTKFHDEISDKDLDLKYDAGRVNYYKNIFNQMLTCGYITTKDAQDVSDMRKGTMSKNDLKDTNWLVKQLKSGALSLMTYSTVQNGFVNTSLSEDESITEKEDSAAITVAEQKYKNSLDKIERIDKQFDLQLQKLEAEHSALETEYDAINKVISGNISKSFNIFNA